MAKIYSPYGKKLEGLKDYKKFMQEKEAYENAKKKLNKEEFGKSPLGKALKEGIKPIQFKARPISKPIFAPQISQEQGFLQEMFGGSDTFWGTGKNLPVMNGALTSGNGLINSGDDFSETAGMFGMRRRLI